MKQLTEIVTSIIIWAICMKMLVCIGISNEIIWFINAVTIIPMIAFGLFHCIVFWYVKRNDKLTQYKNSN